MNSERMDYFQVSFEADTFLNRSNKMLGYLPMLLIELEEIYNEPSLRP
jgi:hypothetical protein